MNHKVFEEAPYVFKLKNGLTVHLLKTDALVTFVQLDIPIGGMTLNYKKEAQIKSVIPGSAHFLEHKIFATKDGDGFQKLAAYGVSANAMTTYRHTSYTITGHTNILPAVIYLINLLDEPYFTLENVNAERKIINEEIQMYDDDPDTLIERKLFSQIIHHHPLTHDILGTKKDISKITKETLLTLHEDFYMHQDRQLLMTGPFDVKEVENALNNAFMIEKKTSTVEILNTSEPKEVKIKLDTLALDVFMPSLSVGFKYIHKENDYKVRYKNGIMMNFMMRLLFGKQSSFTEKMIKTQSMNQTFGSDVTNEEQCLIYVIDVNTEHYMKLKDEVENYFFNEAIHALTKQHFDILKRGYLGSYIMELDDNESKLYLYGRFNLQNMTIEEAMDIIDKITLEDILSFYQQFTKDMVSYLYTVPLSK